MAWRNPHRQTISDLSAFPKHLLLSPALLELPHWLLVNYANKVMFEHIVFLFFCNCASLHSLPPSSRGAIRVTEHVSKIYASVTNYNALSLISPLLLPRTGLVMCLPFGEAFGCEFLLFFFLLFSLAAYQCVTWLHICRDRRLQPKRGSTGVWLITDDVKSILEFHFSSSSSSCRSDFEADRWTDRGGETLYLNNTRQRAARGNNRVLWWQIYIGDVVHDIKKVEEITVNSLRLVPGREGAAAQFTEFSMCNLTR